MDLRRARNLQRVSGIDTQPGNPNKSLRSLSAARLFRGFIYASDH
jgi:hypothetical protein